MCLSLLELQKLYDILSWKLHSDRYWLTEVMWDMGVRCVAAVAGLLLIVPILHADTFLLRFASSAILFSLLFWRMRMVDLLKSIYTCLFCQTLLLYFVCYCVTSVTWHLLKVDWLKSTFWFCRSDTISLWWWLRVTLLMKLKSIFYYHFTFCDLANYINSCTWYFPEYTRIEIKVAQNQFSSKELNLLSTLFVSSRLRNITELLCILNVV